MTTGGYYYNPKEPSEYRRKHLMAELGESVSVSSFFPIERYYNAADKVLTAFEDAVARDDIDSAFLYGKRYCHFVLQEMEKHNYFKREKYASQRLKHSKNSMTMMNFLEGLKVRMDKEEEEKYKKYVEACRIAEARREQERKRQEQITAQREKLKYQELLRRAELQKLATPSAPPSSSSSGGDVQQSAMNKLELLMKKSSTSPANATPAPSQDPGPKRPSGRYALSDTDDDDDDDFDDILTNGPAISIGQPLPPPVPPPGQGRQSQPSKSNGNGSVSAPEAPPSYDYAMNTNRPNPFLGRGNNGAPYAVPPPVQHWGEPRPPSYGNTIGSSSLPDPPTRRYPTQHQQPQPAKRKKKIPMRQLRDQGKRQYQQLVQEGRIEIRPVDTYQGRFGRSTNGCTVISPLVVAQHLGTPSGVVLSDQQIKYVIDDECGPLLREIRGKLGLENGSLIIPSDVHDHLVDKNILKQDYFVGATGGNIVGEDHKGEFLKLFKEKNKAGAALFFREHVVSIVKIPVGGNGKAFYDLVDSMPGTTDNRGNPCASRTRCKDEDALDVLLTWYATKKFSESNCSYIDNNDWNDNMADLDPRVFQAFVWGKDNI